MSGGQVFKGDVKFFLDGHISSVPGKVADSTTKIGIHPGEDVWGGEGLCMGIVCVCVCVCACV